MEVWHDNMMIAKGKLKDGRFAEVCVGDLNWFINSKPEEKIHVVCYNADGKEAGDCFVQKGQVEWQSMNKV